MDETVLDWTVPNWITVVLMVILGFAVIGAGVHLFAKMRGKLGDETA
jgi:hypothetical protein